MQKSGFAWHCHHDVLYEFVFDYNDRVKFIKKNKPENERALRLKLFKLIPEDRLPAALLQAREAYDKAREAYDKAWEAYDKAREAYDKAWEAYNKAWEAYDKAREAHIPFLEQLHAELCPDCPWDGRTIFSKEDKPN